MLHKPKQSYEASEAALKILKLDNSAEGVTRKVDIIKWQLVYLREANNIGLFSTKMSELARTMNSKTVSLAVN